MLRYWSWYSNETGSFPNADVFVGDISNDGGQTWTNVETVGPTGPGTSGGWQFHEFTVSDIVTPTAEIMLRFVASDEDRGSIIEAAIDDLPVTLIVGDACDPSTTNCHCDLHACATCTVRDLLSPAGPPDPDLLVRTATERRISNFLLWQISYAEIHVTDVFWPDFRTEALHTAIKDYASRERRYGALAR